MVENELNDWQIDASAVPNLIHYRRPVMRLGVWLIYQARGDGSSWPPSPVPKNRVRAGF
jgi:hypothetical protein